MRGDWCHYDYKNFKIDRFMYKGVAYSIGTKVLVKDDVFGLQEATFVGWTKHGGFVGKKYHDSFRTDDCSFIIKIIEPVYYEEKKSEETKESWLPAGDGPFYALLWYIAIMMIGTIFKARFAIWIIATISFVGYIKREKK